MGSPTLSTTLSTTAAADALPTAWRWVCQAQQSHSFEPEREEQSYETVMNMGGFGVPGAATCMQNKIERVPYKEAGPAGNQTVWQG